jgi:hypothetical protein
VIKIRNDKKVNKIRIKNVNKKKGRKKNIKRKGMYIKREKMMEDKEMLRNEKKVNRKEKDIIIGFMDG